MLGWREYAVLFTYFYRMQPSEVYEMTEDDIRMYHEGIDKINKIRSKEG